MPYNFVAKLCSRLASSKVRFQMENGRLRFEPPLGAYRQRTMFILGSL